MFHTHNLPKVPNAASVSNSYECQNNIPQPEGFLAHGLGWFGKELCYGHGWFSGKILKNKKIVFHPGNIDGFSSLVIFVPEDQIGLVVLTNQSLNPLPGKLAQRIFSKLYGTELQDSFKLPKMPSPTEPPPAPEKIKPIFGDYIHPAYGHLKIIDKSSGEINVQLGKNEWKASIVDEHTINFTLSLFGGMPLPLSATFSKNRDYVEVPFHLDPLTPLVRLYKVPPHALR